MTVEHVHMNFKMSSLAVAEAQQLMKASQNLSFVLVSEFTHYNSLLLL